MNRRTRSHPCQGTRLTTRLTRQHYRPAPGRVTCRVRRRLKEANMPRNGENTGVEIKLSFDQQVARALDKLGLDGHGEPRRIGFLEDTTVGVALPLFHQRIVLRVRQIDDDDDDATVKLRPCRHSQLAGNWLGAEEGDGWKLTVEQDWAGSRRALAASC